MTINKEQGLFKPSQRCRGTFYLKQAFALSAFRISISLLFYKMTSARLGKKPVHQDWYQHGQEHPFQKAKTEQWTRARIADSWEGQGQEQNHQHSPVEAVSTWKPKNPGSWTKGIGTGKPRAVAAHLAWPVWPCDWWKTRELHLQGFLGKPDLKMSCTNCSRAPHQLEQGWWIPHALWKVLKCIQAVEKQMFCWTQRHFSETQRCHPPTGHRCVMVTPLHTGWGRPQTLLCSENAVCHSQTHPAQRSGEQSARN